MYCFSSSARPFWCRHSHNRRHNRRPLLQRLRRAARPRRPRPRHSPGSLHRLLLRVCSARHHPRDAVPQLVWTEVGVRGCRPLCGLRRVHGVIDEGDLNAVDHEMD